MMMCKLGTWGSVKTSLFNIKSSPMLCIDRYKNYMQRMIKKGIVSLLLGSMQENDNVTSFLKTNPCSWEST